MRQADDYTIKNGTPGKELMLRAAQGVFDSYEGWAGADSLILCGSGNNGGDGYALAMILAEHKYDVRILRVSDKLSDDGGYYYGKCRELDIPMTLMDDMLKTDDMAAEEICRCDVMVDCILGTGFAGEPRGNAAEGIRMINEVRKSSAAPYVISVDINSGMNGDTGEATLAVVSDLTVSIGYYKTGQFAGRSEELIGELVNVDIGIELP